jgi:hypothetical protein
MGVIFAVVAVGIGLYQFRHIFKRSIPVTANIAETVRPITAGDIVQVAGSDINEKGEFPEVGATPKLTVHVVRTMGAMAVGLSADFQELGELSFPMSAASRA